ncbi:uncharacterized protein CEXT_741841 [Caerostris extrusa]|uniref:Uncharacterized protein n=1 Tax=Caerostris extrusa TaxID=172846 RepID=A0AAV4VEM8_CAEEX|nr:uncharacterized protein CEXT_741841 [Caerostris extrusa]
MCNVPRTAPRVLLPVTGWDNDPLSIHRCFCELRLLKCILGRFLNSQVFEAGAHTRILAIGGFFLSIPLFFTGIILFTFIHFNEVPAMATSIVIGLGIVFCGVASVHNVYLWQWEKTRACKELQQSRLSQLGLDCSAQRAMELSTLV